MKIYLTDQKKNFERHLNDLRTKSVMEYDKNRLTKKISIIEIETEKIDFHALFDYKIFPVNIMTHLTEWKLNNREMKVGDTIVQQVYIPPTRIFSQKIVFGVRISEIIDEPSKKGFSYETLDGHVEKGVSTFTLEQTNEKTVFKIMTYSAPGNFLTRALGPIFSRPYQKYSTEEALKNVKRQIEKSTKAQQRL
ncbi:DUF1990 family protein [Allomuricauda sp. MMSF_3316]|uniref:DUF1990 family protein n=2 Tax=Allomuricauda TaxID=111500 RepID=UPI00273F7190|nr:DUF1990 family protein [Muricauda sp. MMSF_3316]